MINQEKPDSELLAKFFSIPAKPKAKRIPKVVRLLNAKGYEVEKYEDGWEVSHPKAQGVVAIYDRLSDIPEEDGGISI